MLSPRRDRPADYHLITAKRPLILTAAATGRCSFRLHDYFWRVFQLAVMDHRPGGRISCPERGIENITQLVFTRTGVEILRQIVIAEEWQSNY